jgi:hypothetical protein
VLILLDIEFEREALNEVDGEFEYPHLEFLFLNVQLASFLVV